ncbi:MAG: hypothetical protein EP306_03580 [Burkholderiales bacterium]|nr:MAG: hypothetical protein EP306_03580 [Burkholderiales bacterium]
MSYTLTLHTPDGASPQARQQAERRFCRALEEALGDAALVVPVYEAVQRIRAQHGPEPDLEALTPDERTVLELWLQAESAALAAVFGPHRHLDEGGYEIRLD